MKSETNSLLVVDDEELNRDGLSRHLQRHGYEVGVAKNGREAIDQLGNRRYDLVLLDIMMPGMNGLEVLKFLRRVDSLLDLPIVMVTARGESEEVVEALELGANDYLTKPLDFPVVLARIRTQLALKRAVAQVTELEQKLDARNRELEAAAAELAAAGERVQRDLDAAARVQQAFLPARRLEVPGARFAWTFRPCSRLSGDFLNVFRIDDRHTGLCLLDANGHGAAAALLAVAASHQLARMAVGPGAECVPPTQVAEQLADQVAREAINGKAFTLLYGVLGPNGRQFRFVSAGHPGPVHLPRGGSPVEQKVTGFPLGMGSGDYREQVVELKPGDRLMLFSDGLTQTRNAAGEHFGTRRLLAALNAARDASLDEMLAALLKNFDDWCGDTPGQDDLSLLGVETTA